MTAESAPTEITVAHHTATVNGVRLHYVTAGRGEPLVLLHGLPQTWYEWRRVMPRLAEHYTLIVPDLRGAGFSAKPDTGYDTNNLAEDIHELVEQLGYEQIFLVGHDWGGAVAYSYAAQHREEVRRLAILEMVLPGFGIIEGAMVPQEGGEFLWHMGFQSVPDIPQALIQGRERTYFGFWFQHYAYDPTAVGPEEIDEYMRAVTQVGALRSHLEYYKSFFLDAKQNAEHAKTKLEMPVLALAGEACLGDLTRQCLEETAEDVRGGVIERCGHWVAEERPEYLTERLLAFFEDTQ